MAKFPAFIGNFGGMEKRAGLIFLFFALIVAACSEEKEFSPVPEVKFERFIQYKDAAGRDTAVDFVFSLTDGDGDIGFTDNEFNTDCGADNNNLYMKYEEKSGALYRPKKFWQEVVDVDANCDTTVFFDSVQVAFNQRMQYIEPAGNSKSIEAVVTYRLDYISSLVLLSNTGRFEFYIRDRANQKSNTVLTPDLSIIK